MKYRPEVDGLRAVAVLPVVLFHAGFSVLSGGFVGVDVFFVISGYLITHIIATEVAAGRFSIVDFYERRIRRIFPALFLVLLCALPLAIWRLLPTDLEEFGQSLVALVAFSTNMYFWSRSGYFSSDADLKPLLHTWSLSVEEQFYVFFPLLMILMRNWPRRLQVGVLSFFAFISLAMAQWGAMNKPILAFFFLPTRAWELLVGSLVALTEQRIRQRLTSGAVRELLAFTGLGMILLAMLIFDHRTPFPGLSALLPVLGSALVILFCVGGSPLSRVLGSKWLVGVGMISYSLYLWHHPIFAFSRHFGWKPNGNWLAAGLVLFSVLLAWFSWRYVENPFRDRKKFSRHQIFMTAGSVMSVTLLVGAALSLTDGWLSRYSPADQELVGVSSIQRGTYVRAHFEAVHHRPFDPQDRRIKVLLVGDSYAKDFINAVALSELNQHVQISTHSISVGCGNLYLEEDIAPLVSNSYPPLCEAEGRYRSPTARQLLEQADVVWLASAWQPWEAQRLASSLAALRRDFGNKFVVLGAKDFGAVNARAMLSIPEMVRPDFMQSVNPGFLRTRQIVRAAMEGQPFLDIQMLICGAGAYCPLFDQSSRPLSYDGGHLTKFGAQWLSGKLNAPEVHDILLGAALNRP